MTHAIDSPSPLDTIPDPENIRNRLSALFSEARLLRRLLSVAVEVRRVRSRDGATDKEGRHAQ
jgi:hypothetical protein